MLHESRNAKTSRSKKTKNSSPTPNDRRANFGGREKSKPSGNLSKRKYSAKSVFSLEDKIQGSRNRRAEGSKTRKKTQKRSQGGELGKRTRTSEISIRRSKRRATTAEKKREFGLHGDLGGQHLAKEKRDALIVEIKLWVAKGEAVTEICKTLEISTRAYYRWISGETNKNHHGGGGGNNKITPLEEKRVVAFARKNPEMRCRRIAYELERRAVVFIGKTRVAKILKDHGINHEFVKKQKEEKTIPAEMLLHEPWRKNLLWGTDWTYLKIAGKFWFLLLIIDWYSRKIISFGLFPEITKFQVVAVVTEGVALEGIDELGPDALKPRLVADHGSANIAKYTRTNIEVQGLDIWLSGVGRPTGNARAERVMNTLKREEYSKA